MLRNSGTQPSITQQTLFSAPAQTQPSITQQTLYSSPAQTQPSITQQTLYSSSAQTQPSITQQTLYSSTAQIQPSITQQTLHSSLSRTQPSITLLTLPSSPAQTQPSIFQQTLQSSPYFISCALYVLHGFFGISEYLCCTCSSFLFACYLYLFKIHSLSIVLLFFFALHPSQFLYLLSYECKYSYTCITSHLPPMGHIYSTLILIPSTRNNNFSHIPLELPTFT